MNHFRVEISATIYEERYHNHLMHLGWSGSQQYWRVCCPTRQYFFVKMYY